MIGLVAGLAFFGGVCALYMIVMTPVHAVRNVRAARAGRSAAAPVVPDDKHVAFPDDEPPAGPPRLHIVR